MTQWQKELWAYQREQERPVITIPLEPVRHSLTNEEKNND